MNENALLINKNSLENVRCQPELWDMIRAFQGRVLRENIELILQLLDDFLRRKHRAVIPKKGEE